MAHEPRGRALALALSLVACSVACASTTTTLVEGDGGGVGEEPVVIVGLWREGTGASAVTHDQPWPPTLDGELEAGEAAKLEIFEIETYQLESKRRFAAVWREMDGASRIERGLTFSKLRKRANREVDGVRYRLRDFECYEDHHGKIRYVGVWRPEDLRVRVERRLTYDDLSVRTAGTQDGVRLGLADIEVCPRKGGGEQYVALWVEGEEKSLLKDTAEWRETEGWTRDGSELHQHDGHFERFHHWFHNVDRSLRLHDVEKTELDRRVGLWVTGTECDWWWSGRGWHRFRVQPRLSADGPADGLIDPNSCNARLGALRVLDIEVLPVAAAPGSGSSDTGDHPPHGADGSGGPE